MKRVLFFALAALVVASTDPLFFEFTQFVAKYGKYYQTQEEFDYRFQAFKGNKERIAELNQANIKAGGESVFGVNIFADMPHHEFAQRLMKNQTTYPVHGSEVAPKASAPQADVDWRTKNCITAVKDQGQCGSCWAFSATEATESFYYLINPTSHQLYDLSAQQVTACTYNYNGCNGGWPYDGYENGIIKRQGEDDAADYPYNIAQAGNCKFGATGKADAPMAWLTTYKSYAKGQLQNVLDTVGPPSICVAADAWQTYTGGILKTCPGEVDHCVQAVGYTTSGSESYWVVRNSWGASWGEKGYIYLDMTADNGDICHIQEYITVPTAQN
jgi:C1A family cysteine protease